MLAEIDFPELTDGLQRRAFREMQKITALRKHAAVSPILVRGTDGKESQAIMIRYDDDSPPDVIEGHHATDDLN